MAKWVWTRKKQRIFLDALRSSANVSAAARRADMPRREAYRLRAQDEDFRKDWDHAFGEALDDLEAELRRRAMEGVEKPVYYGGKACGSVRNYSDSLGMFLLKSRRPHIFDGTDERSADEGARQNLISARERLADLLEQMADRCAPVNEHSGHDSAE